MPTITTPPLPADSLLARLRGPECYRDAFRVEVPGRVTLAEFLRAFYASPAFTPERLLLGLFGHGGTRADIAALAEGRADRFAAWRVEAREGPASSSGSEADRNGQPAGGEKAEILMRDFQDRTCSWLKVEPLVEDAEERTRLWFGSAVRRPEEPLVAALMPFHRWYSRRLLAGAVASLKRCFD